MSNKKNTIEEKLDIILNDLKHINTTLKDINIVLDKVKNHYDKMNPRSIKKFIN